VIVVVAVTVVVAVGSGRRCVVPHFVDVNEHRGAERKKIVSSSFSKSQEKSSKFRTGNALLELKKPPLKFFLQLI
jgi:hypothetical protein